MKTKMAALLMLTLLAAGPATAPIPSSGAHRIVEVKTPHLNGQSIYREIVPPPVMGRSDLENLSSARVLPSESPEILKIAIDVDVPGQSAEVNESMADATVNVLKQRVEDYRKKWMSSELENKSLAESEIPELEKHIPELEKKIPPLAAKVGDASPEQIASEAAVLSIEKPKLELELVGLQARREAIAEAMAKLRVQAQAAAGPAIEALKKEVEVHQRRFKQLSQMAQTGQASVTEVTEAEAKMLDAQARLAAKQNSGEDAGTLSELNHLLIATSINEREIQAKLKAITDRTDLARSAAELKALRKDLDRAKTRLENDKESLKHANEFLQSYGKGPLEITVKTVPQTTAPTTGESR